jgi:hypothetical protein
MSNLKDVASAFLDGMGSLGFLFESAERPGSRENLIYQSESPALDPNLLTEAVLNQGADVPGIVFRLRTSADLIESRYEVLRQAATKQAGTLHVP